MTRPKYTKANAYKIVICGDGAVGKTTISMRLTGNKNYDDTHELTPGVDFHSLILTDGDNAKIDCQIWDLGGQEYFRDFQDDFFESATVIVFVCSVDRFLSLENLENWMMLLPIELDRIDKKYLIANKIDIPDRALDTDILLDFAEVFELDYYEMSAFTGIGFDEFKENLIGSIKLIYHQSNN